MSIPLDIYDQRILALLQEESSLSTAEIAERIGLSQSPCWRRIQRLKDVRGGVGGAGGWGVGLGCGVGLWVFFL
ncbi:Lrp/AsnC family transcriptional regulator, partial [Pseudomonas aeruginosa]|uniref:Lrp/AsnC family transcriptional regulator n=1 Tax=Pseudomonas aeruginosa TaxID=287 RepID=UPI003981DF70